MHDECPIERNLRHVKQAAFFRAADKAGFSIPILAAETGISRATLDSYLPMPSRPKPAIMSLAVFVKLAAVKDLPPHVTALLIDDSGLDLVAREPSRTNWLALAEKMCGFGGKVLRFQSTGNHIDHREEAELREDVIEIISEGQGAIAANG
jgi:hypothetical protein